MKQQNLFTILQTIQNHHKRSTCIKLYTTSTGEKTRVLKPFMLKVTSKMTPKANKSFQTNYVMGLVFVTGTCLDAWRELTNHYQGNQHSFPSLPTSSSVGRREWGWRAQTGNCRGSRTRGTFGPLCLKSCRSWRDCWSCKGKTL